MRSISTLPSSSTGNSGLDAGVGTAFTIGGRWYRSIRGNVPQPERVVCLLTHDSEEIVAIGGNGCLGIFARIRHLGDREGFERYCRVLRK